MGSPFDTDSSTAGRVEGIFITPEYGGLPMPVPTVRAVAGKGLKGNRYFGDGVEITLIEAESLEAILAEHRVELSAAESRRNVLTRGVRLNELAGLPFRIGTVECVGIDLCAPCSYLQDLTRPGVLRALAGRGGLNASLLKGGQIRHGDQIVKADGWS